jgi:hypothetical protein
MICSTPYTVSHHIEPICEGGGNDWMNLIVLCPNCHHRVHIIKDISESQLRIYREDAEDGSLNKPKSKAHCSGACSLDEAHKSEKKMWNMYFSVLPSLKEGKHWLPQNAEEVLVAEKLVKHGILERFAPGEYLSSGANEDEFACGHMLR